MGPRIARNDYEWTTSTEPHASRRDEILRKYTTCDFISIEIFFCDN